ncbi:aspartyl/asparaginyl beta-hydroxylase domain-containing protein [Sphingomonas sp. SUN039]|uniref:aspartyl/asparaginyl beta-hydroxylase domain-containing protein n=1 Tax=Sphingomonas sp. SUN039 TaxID=2937787 RepID=UPI002164E3BD|nr:aspartyl/asparaginyl beta-hydroxylase domain-containing protein [Sphingomonas sp. SUN039]UVO54883.1 aspartyl/asparaginyl beta-hydroxylase domain-containing protein [Sphingomonas sp. SUN039]
MTRPIDEQPSCVTDRWPDRVRLPFAFDPAALQADLAAFDTTDWTRHFVPQNYEGKWDVLPLRAKRGATHPVAMIYSDPVATDYVDTPWLDHAPCLRAVLAQFDCTMLSARLMRLTPGSTIKEHSDLDLDAALGRARIHVPVITNDDVVFLLNRVAVDMAPGSVWYLRLADPHYVHNGGTTDRVHLVIDVLTNDWVVAQLDAGVATEAG